MIANCTNCDNELGKLFVLIDRHTGFCLDGAEKRTATIDRQQTE
ncbi:hypothetical protein [Brevibacterium sp. UCMA 11754]|nr:hypothetical protein [Brevibacterium sp. UCMA 11754]